MNRFKRWTVSMSSRLDQVIGQIENHEAVVTSTLREMQQAAARAKVQLRRVQSDGRLLQQRLRAEREAVETWRGRALSCGEGDSERAIECLRRSKRAAARTDELAERVADHRRSEQQLVKDVRQVEQRIVELNEKRNLMRTRQSRAEALQGLRCESLEVEQLQDVFDRWDTRVTDLELTAGTTDPADALESEFVSREERAALAAELEALRHDTATADEDAAMDKEEVR
jgi:phage shock protein A